MSKPKKILIIGNPFFGRLIAEGVPPVTDRYKFLVFDTGKSRAESLRYLYHLPTADLVFAIMADLNGGGALKAASMLGKPILQEFIGCDVTQAKADLAINKINKRLMKHSHFICNAPWLVEELAEVGFQTEFVRDYLRDVPPQTVPLPKQFSVLAYVGAYDEDLYGMPSMIECAKALPDVPFRITGLAKSKYEIPSNMTLLGWTDKMDQEFDACTVHMRLTRHDGMGHAVIQALGKGRWVIRTNNMPGTFHAATSEQAISELRKLQQAFQQGTLQLNEFGHQYALKNFAKKTVVNDLLSAFDKAINTEPRDYFF